MLAIIAIWLLLHFRSCSKRRIWTIKRC